MKYFLTVATLITIMMASIIFIFVALSSAPSSLIGQRVEVEWLPDTPAYVVEKSVCMYEDYNLCEETYFVEIHPTFSWGIEYVRIVRVFRQHMTLADDLPEHECTN